MYVYKRSEPELWTVGFYDTSGEWNPDSDWGSPAEAGARVHYLNGGVDTQTINDLTERVEALEAKDNLAESVALYKAEQLIV